MLRLEKQKRKKKQKKNVPLKLKVNYDAALKDNCVFLVIKGRESHQKKYKKKKALGLFFRQAHQEMLQRLEC